MAGKYRAVPAAEKYAEGPRPLCKCHGVEMWWGARNRSPAGGYWSCAERERERHRKKYRTDPEYAERQREWKREKRRTGPYAERERERHREREREKRRTDPEWAERERERHREAIRTPGMARYNEAHGIGLPGLHKYLRNRKHDLTRQHSEITADLAEVRAEIAQLEQEINNG